MAQVVCHRLLTAKARFRSQARPRGVCGGQIVFSKYAYVEFPYVEFPYVEFPYVEFPYVEFPYVEFPLPLSFHHCSRLIQSSITDVTQS